MLEERGQVVSVADGRVRVAVQRQSACGACQARAACGQGLMQALQPGRCHEVEALSDLVLQEGDMVTIGINAGLMVRSAILVYLLPLLVLIAGALLGQWLEAGEGWTIVLAAAGFAASCAYLYRFNQRQRNNADYMPVVLRAEPKLFSVSN